MQEITRTAPAPAGIGLDLIKVPENATLSLDVRLESVAEGVLLSGTVSVVAVGECGRCLDPVSLDLVVSLTDLYAYPGSVTDETTDEDEISRLVDDRIDAEPAIRDALVLALPLTPLCRPNCEGLCSGCGGKWAELPDDHSHELIDPRWAALSTKFETADDDDDPDLGRS